eukprot:1153051-Pelagomonas_calceolata.AAC.2
MAGRPLLCPGRTRCAISTRLRLHMPGTNASKKLMTSCVWSARRGNAGCAESREQTRVNGLQRVWVWRREGPRKAVLTNSLSRRASFFIMPVVHFLIHLPVKQKFLTWNAQHGVSK